MTDTTNYEWDLTDPLNAQPRYFPKCGDCHLPYVYRWGWDLNTGKGKFAWHRDCNHKKASPIMANND